MRLIYCWISLFLMTLCCFNTANASHIYGGELLYKHLQGDTYQINLVLYGDCQGRIFDSLKVSTPEVTVFRNNNFNTAFQLFENTSLRAEVTPVCDKDKDNTSCKSITNTIPGVTRFVYSNTVDLPPATNWRIAFQGQMSVASQAGRSDNISNIFAGGQGGSLLYLEATLNNQNGPNSSPEYTSIPTPFYCVNTAQQYNQGAIDPDGDSLRFSLIPALRSSTQNVNYVPPYTGASPLAVVQGSFGFNGANGQLNFIPNALQYSLAVNKVEEYKDGILVGSSMREMSFIIIQCNNSPPYGTVDSTSIQGGLTRDNIVNVCANTPLLKFQIPIIDVDKNNIEVSLTNAPPGSKVEVLQNGSTKPVIEFSWSTIDVGVGTYNMFITYKDDACPLFASQTVAYTINVVKDIEVADSILQLTNCFGMQHMQFKLYFGVLPRIVTITHSNGTENTYIDTTGIIVDSFKTGTYKFRAESELLKCITEYSFTVVDSGIYPIAPAHDNPDVCIWGEPQKVTVRPLRGAPVNWYSDFKTSQTEQPEYNTNEARVIKWLVSQTVDVCESIKDTVYITVHNPPEIEIQNKAERICIGEGVPLTATGGVRYEWMPYEKVTDYDGQAYTYVNEPSTYIVKGYSQYNCPANDTITFSDIELCCKFSYPDAFTPNNDGINDSWNPITYGNVNAYLLSIYDRWGKRIFMTSDPRVKWNGTYKGHLCEVGTYHYFLRANCVAGRKEETSGSFILIR